MKKSKRINCRVSEETFKKFEQISSYMGINKTSTIVYLINQKEKEIKENDK